MAINICLALLIAITYSCVAFLAWQVFFFYGITRPVGFIVAGFIKIAASWVVNVIAQISTGDIRTVLISVSLTGILFGAINVCLGLFDIYWYTIRSRHGKAG